MKVDPSLTLLTKINLKYIKDLNVRHETIKLLEENMEEISLTLVLAMIFVNMMTKAKTKINKWNYIKLKSCIAKETINKMKSQPKEWEKIFANHIFLKLIY